VAVRSSVRSRQPSFAKSAERMSMSVCASNPVGRGAGITGLKGRFIALTEASGHLRTSRPIQFLAGRRRYVGPE
jgi:hypothetical protein